MTQVKSHTRNINGKVVAVKQHQRKEPVLTAKELIKEKDKKIRKEFMSNVEKKYDDLMDRTINNNKQTQRIIMEDLEKGFGSSTTYAGSNQMIIKNLEGEEIYNSDRTYKSKKEFLDMVDKNMKPVKKENNQFMFKENSDEKAQDLSKRKTLTKEQSNELFSKGGTPSLRISKIYHNTKQSTNYQGEKINSKKVEMNNGDKKYIANANLNNRFVRLSANSREEAINKVKKSINDDLINQLNSKQKKKDNLREGVFDKNDNLNGGM